MIAKAANHVGAYLQVKREAGKIYVRDMSALQYSSMPKVRLEKDEKTKQIREGSVINLSTAVALGVVKFDAQTVTLKFLAELLPSSKDHKNTYGELYTA